MDMESAIQDYAESRGKELSWEADSYSWEEKKLIEKIYQYNRTPAPHRRYIFSNEEEVMLEQMKDAGKIEYEKQNSIPYWNFKFAGLTYDDFVNSPLKRDNIGLSEIEAGLAQYLENLDYDAPIDKENLAYQLLYRFWKNVPKGKIYSFNYTSLEPLIRTFDPSADLSSRIVYMHGSLEKKHLILGAGIESGNKYGEWNFLSKTQDNAYASTDLVSEMQNAENIFVYGLSFGKTDIHYFEDVFNSMIDNKKSKNIQIYTMDCGLIKGNIKNIDALQAKYGVCVVDCMGKDSTIFDQYLKNPKDIEIFQRNLSQSFNF